VRLRVAVYTIRYASDPYPTTAELRRQSPAQTACPKGHEEHKAHPAVAGPASGTGELIGTSTLSPSTLDREVRKRASRTHTAARARRRASPDWKNRKERTFRAGLRRSRSDEGPARSRTLHLEVGGLCPRSRSGAASDSTPGAPTAIVGFYG
jgi:hypothetical protein